MHSLIFTLFTLFITVSSNFDVLCQQTSVQHEIIVEQLNALATSQTGKRENLEKVILLVKKYSEENRILCNE